MIKVVILWHKQYEDLEESMTDALENDKPQFVCLFIDNGLNILNYLTYGRLEGLYNSISKTSQTGMLLQHLLDERINESNDQKAVVSLYEVRSGNIGRLISLSPIHSNTHLQAVS